MSGRRLYELADIWDTTAPDLHNPYYEEILRRATFQGYAPQDSDFFETGEAADVLSDYHLAQQGGEQDPLVDALTPAHEKRMRQQYLEEEAVSPEKISRLYELMSQNDPYNPVFTAGEPMDLAFRLLKNRKESD